MNYNAITDTSSEKRSEFVTWLSAQTVTALKNAQSNPAELQAAIKEYLLRAKNANLELEEIENILGMNELCILDTANLSEEDEEVVIDIFEQLTE